MVRKQVFLSFYSFSGTKTGLMYNMGRLPSVPLKLIPNHGAGKGFLPILVVNKNAGLLFFIESPKGCYF